MNGKSQDKDSQLHERLYQSSRGHAQKSLIDLMKKENRKIAMINRLKDVCKISANIYKADLSFKVTKASSVPLNKRRFLPDHERFKREESYDKAAENSIDSTDFGKRREKDLQLRFQAAVEMKILSSCSQLLKTCEDNRVRLNIKSYMYDNRKIQLVKHYMDPVNSNEFVNLVTHKIHACHTHLNHRFISRTVKDANSKNPTVFSTHDIFTEALKKVEKLKAWYIQNPYSPSAIVDFLARLDHNGNYEPLDSEKLNALTKLTSEKERIIEKFGLQSNHSVFSTIDKIKSYHQNLTDDQFEFVFDGPPMQNREGRVPLEQQWFERRKKVKEDLEKAKLKSKSMRKKIEVQSKFMDTTYTGFKKKKTDASDSDIFRQTLIKNEQKVNETRRHKLQDVLYPKSDHVHSCHRFHVHYIPEPPKAALKPQATKDWQSYNLPSKLPDFWDIGPSTMTALEPQLNSSFGSLRKMRNQPSISLEYVVEEESGQYDRFQFGGRSIGSQLLNYAQKSSDDEQGRKELFRRLRDKYAYLSKDETKGSKIVQRRKYLKPYFADKLVRLRNMVVENPQPNTDKKLDDSDEELTVDCLTLNKSKPVEFKTEYEGIGDDLMKTGMSKQIRDLLPKKKSKPKKNPEYFLSKTVTKIPYRCSHTSMKGLEGFINVFNSKVDEVNGLSRRFRSSSDEYDNTKNVHWNISSTKSQRLILAQPTFEDLP